MSRNLTLEQLIDFIKLNLPANEQAMGAKAIIKVKKTKSNYTNIPDSWNIDIKPDLNNTFYGAPRASGVTIQYPIWVVNNQSSMRIPYDVEYSLEQLEKFTKKIPFVIKSNSPVGFGK